MPEIPLCKHCNRSVDFTGDDYVIPNKMTADEEAWEYEHEGCHNDHVSEVEASAAVPVPESQQKESAFEATVREQGSYFPRVD